MRPRVKITGVVGLSLILTPPTNDQDGERPLVKSVCMDFRAAVGVMMKRSCWLALYAGSFFANQKVGSVRMLFFARMPGHFQAGCGALRTVLGIFTGSGSRSWLSPA